MIYFVIVIFENFSLKNGSFCFLVSVEYELKMICLKKSYSS